MTIRVATWLRLSSKKQARNQGGTEPDIPAQRMELDKFIREQPEWVFVREFKEVISAYRTEMSERQVVEEILSCAERGEFHVLLTWKSDRISREQADSLQLLKRLDKFGVKVWTVADGAKCLSVATPVDKLVRSVEAMAAEQASWDTSVRVQTRLSQLAEQGKWCGGHVAYGYRLVPKLNERGEPILKGPKAVRELIPDPETAPVVQNIFRLYLSGMGDTLIANHLNSLGLVTGNGATWKSKAVHDILTNPLYCGRVAWRRVEIASRRAGKVERKRSDNPIVSQGTHEALVSPEEWDEAQQIRASRAGIPMRQRNTEYIFAGVVRCARCRSTMGGTMRKIMKQGETVEYPTYRCSLRKKASTCDAPTVVGTSLEDAFLTAIEALWSPNDLRARVEQRFAEAQTQLNVAREERKQVQDELAKVERALKRLDAAFLEADDNDAMPEAEYKTKRFGYVQRRAQLQALLKESLPSVDIPDFTRQVEAAKQVRANWGYLNPFEKRAAAMSILESFGYWALVDRPEGGKTVTVTFVEAQ